MNILILTDNEVSSNEKPLYLENILLKSSIKYLIENLISMGFVDIYVLIKKRDDIYKDYLRNCEILYYESFDSSNFNLEDTLIIPCYIPLIKINDLNNFIEYHYYNDNEISILSTQIIQNKSYPSIMNIKNNLYIDEIRRSNKVALGVYILKLIDIDLDLFLNGKVIKSINKAIKTKKTGLYEINYSYEYYFIKKADDIFYISTILKNDIIEYHKKNDVIILDSNTTSICNRTKIMPKTIIYPFTIIEDSFIGYNNRIGPFAYVNKTITKDNEVIKNYYYKDDNKPSDFNK